MWEVKNMGIKKPFSLKFAKSQETLLWAHFLTFL